MGSELKVLDARSAWRLAANDSPFLRWEGGGYASPLRASANQPTLLTVPASEDCCFEIFREDEERITATRHSGGDWRWRFVTANGELLAEASGYPTEAACRSAVTALQHRAAGAPSVSRPAEHT